MDEEEDLELMMNNEGEDEGDEEDNSEGEDDGDGMEDRDSGDEEGEEDTNLNTLLPPPNPSNNTLSDMSKDSALSTSGTTAATTTTMDKKRSSNKKQESIAGKRKFVLSDTVKQKAADAVKENDANTKLSQGKTSNKNGGGFGFFYAAAKEKEIDLARDRFHWDKSNYGEELGLKKKIHLLCKIRQTKIHLFTFSKSSFSLI